MELVLIAVSLSMDAFAVSMCKGLGMKTLRYAHGAVIALFFGVFQAVMPLIGWLLGKQFERYIASVDHWIAFGLLGYIGWKMIWDATHEQEESGFCPVDQNIHYKELFILAVATSIDALAVGITFAFLQTPIFPAMLLIGGITAVLCFGGVLLGHRFGIRYQKKAQVAGGTVLITIGLKILLEHLGVITP
ncbi:MAG: manganese efflux pump MntP family protein [Candidatus Limiplasma sp.]|nr:manganese efflux pump MntP family protein [Candidatus Limiplasma sp.]